MTGQSKQTREQMLANRKAYRESNKEKIRLASKKYYEEHKEEINEKNKKYYDANPEYQKNYSKKINSVKIPCNVCGCMTFRSHKIRHQKSKTCQKFLKNELNDLMNDMITEIEKNI